MNTHIDPSELLKLALEFQPDTTNSYVSSYPSLLSYFQSVDLIDWSTLVVGTHSVYGWMPRVLKINDVNKEHVLYLVNQVKLKEKELNKDELVELKQCINNSIIGVSKLLHFLCPTRYAIWDSKVGKNVYSLKHHYQINNVNNYMSYLRFIKELSQLPEAIKIRSSISNKIGYEVTVLRAIELIMFSKSAKT